MTPPPRTPRRQWGSRLATAAHTLLLRLCRDERGEISQYAVVTALGVLLALAIFAIIRAVVLEWANSIPNPGA